jgi:hypothetical protein
MSALARLLKEASKGAPATDKGDSEDIGAALRRELRDALKSDSDDALDQSLRAVVRHYSKD